MDELTPWICSSIKPIREGIYETYIESEYCNKTIGYTNWVNNGWSYQFISFQDALAHTEHSDVQNKVWRELANKPKGDEMNTPHKWAKEICHKANGGEVECRLINNSFAWSNVVNESFEPFNNPDYEFRIKPERVYPVTSLSANELRCAFNAGADPETSTDKGFLACANLAIKRHIDDTEGGA